jgi:hypothetical protein
LEQSGALSGASIGPKDYIQKHKILYLLALRRRKFFQVEIR